MQVPLQYRGGLAAAHNKHPSVTFCTNFNADTGASAAAATVGIAAAVAVVLWTCRPCLLLDI